MIDESAATTDEKDSPYYWWFEYLKRHEGYRQCCENGGTGEFSELYNDFGNVHGVSFSDWWASHRDLFWHPPKFTVREVSDEAEFRDYRSYSKRTLVVAVNLWEPKETLEKEFHKLLRDRHPGERGRPKWSDELSDRYALKSRPNVHALETTLKVYDLRKGTSLRAWEISQRLDLGRGHHVTRERDLDAFSKKRSMKSIVSRYLSHADALIYNVGQGVFPKRDYIEDSHEADSDE